MQKAGQAWLWCDVKAAHAWGSSHSLCAGAIRVTAGASVLVENSVFDSNLGPTGGAITLDGGSSIIIQVALAAFTLR